MTAPGFRLAPGTGWRAAAPSAGGFRNSRWDRAALAVTLNPSWLLAPLFARDAGGLAVSSAGGGAVSSAGGGVPGAGGEVAPLPGPLDPTVVPAVAPVAFSVADQAPAGAAWPTWWDAALAYRPGTPAPDPTDLIAGSPQLRALWAALRQSFADWAATLPAPSPQDGPRRVERDALAGFAHRNGRDPGRWVVRLLQIPVAQHYLYSPEARRIVVSAALRNDPDAYPAALAAELPRHF